MKVANRNPSRMLNSLPSNEPKADAIPEMNVKKEIQNVLSLTSVNSAIIEF